MTRETTTEAAQWRIGPTGVSEEYSDWYRAHPVMVSVHSAPFHFQDHVTATQARELGRALIECADEVESEASDD